MFARGALRRAASAAPSAGGQGAKVVPMSLCCHGNAYAFHYLNHPGVMAVSTLLEMKGVVDMRANFTQENVEALKEFDVELARKGQIALDHGLAVNFLDLEYIDETLPRLLIEKELSQMAQLDILQRKDGDYAPMKSLEPRKKEAVNAAMLKMPSVYKKKMLEDSLHVIETFLETGYACERDAMQALLYYCTLMESPDLELDAKTTKAITAKAASYRAWGEQNLGKVSQKEIETKLKEIKTECNPVVVEKLKAMIEKA
ncbi:unnamed protein product [Amoebophrya sp. A25]|nr:unnamed protein product [Amoebophrya sp. A25]|eukprot:GSA25T00012008001.1